MKKMKLFKIVDTTKIDIINNYWFRIKQRPTSSPTCIISGAADWKIKIENLETGMCIETFDEHTSTVYCILLIETRQELASGSRDFNIKIWNLTNNKCKKTLRGHTQGVYCLTFICDESSNLLVSGSADQTIKFWNIDRGECVKTFFNVHQRLISCLLFIPEIKCLVSGSYDRSIKVWSLFDVSKENEAHHIECVKHIRGHLGYVSFVLFNSCTYELISCSGDKTIRFWSLLDDRKDIEGARVLKSHMDDVVSLILIGPSNKTLVSGSFDKTIKIWDLPKSKLNLFYMTSK